MAIGPFLLAAIGGQGGVKVCGAPGTLSLSAGGTPATQIALSWSAPSDTGGGTVSGYRIKKDGSTLVADTGSTGTTYTATGLTRVTSYNFNVAAINEKGTGADGNTPSLTTSAEVPGAPGTLSLSAGSPATTAINLSWSAPSDTGGATITGYRIKKDGSTLVANTGTTGTTYSATGLTASTSYNFNVAAINSVGTGADGNTPSRTTDAAPVVYTTTGSPTTRTYTSGGTSYKSLHWTTYGTFTPSSIPAGKTFDVWVVSGGGGGGACGSSSGRLGGAGGGGAGGAKSWTSQTLSTASHTVTVGAGGAGGTASGSWGNTGSNGSSSSFAISGGSTLSPTGGGGGGKSVQGGSSGGSGGGACATYSGGSGTSGEGNSGGAGGSGNPSGGGGGGGKSGTGSTGGYGNSGLGGDGGAAGTNDYANGTTSGVGVGVWSGGGGGGSGPNAEAVSSGGSGGGDGAASVFPNLVQATSGTANSGGGGGGSRWGQSNFPSGASGGSGAVVIRWEVG
jgi:hypothetical protein